MTALTNESPARTGPAGPAAARRTHPLLWVPSLYLAMGIPFNVVMGGTAARMYKSLGYPDSRITVAIGAIGVAWSLKPLWAGFLEMYRTKRFFVITMEVVITAILAAAAAAVPLPGFFRISIGLFWVAAFASSTQDICGDGIYLTSLEPATQARMAGVQGTFWILAKVLAAGILISVLDRARVAFHWSDRFLWQAVLLACAGAMAAVAAYHWFRLPAGGTSERPSGFREVTRGFLGTAVSFFHKRGFWGMMAFVFLYRLGEGLILIEGQLFLQSPVARGGLGLSPGAVSDIYAVWGTGFSILGGLLGGVFASRFGLRRSLPILALFLNVPHLTYVALSHIGAAGHGASYGTVTALVSAEQFGYGFGFVGNMIYMMQQIAPGRATMTHYAFATALMNLVLVPTNMVSGPLAEALGFSTFFLVVMFASVPSVWAAVRAPFPQPEARRPPVPGDGSDAGHVRVTVDDPTRLSSQEIEVQRLAGRASMHAMLIAILILMVDPQILGSLQGGTARGGWVALGLLALVAAAKLGLATRALRAAAAALRQASLSGETAYASNARGARLAVLLCGAASVAILLFGGFCALRS